MEQYTIEHPTTGIVIIRKFLSLEEQLFLIDIIEKNGNFKDENGDWNFKNHLNKPLRGREYRRLSNYPTSDAKYLSEMTIKMKHITESIDDTLTFGPVTHMLSLWYPEKRGGGWHQDGNGGGSSDGDKNAPVYSLSLGNTSNFMYQYCGETAKHTVELCSGDIIIFGGPQREMWHMCKSIKMGTFNEKPNFNARINLTFRTCSEYSKEDDEQASTENYNKRVMEKYST